MRHENEFYWFDFCRGIAALLVLAGHIRGLMFIEYQDNFNPGILAKGFYFCTGFGHQAVIIFFVLSGFFIIRSIHELAEKHKWSASAYLFNRLVRLWVVLIPSLFATLLWDSIGLNFFPHSLAYEGAIPYLSEISPHEKLDFFDFIGNVFFLQTIVSPTFGSNAALWSLANEFWYYLLFPLLYFLLRPYYALKIRLLLLSALILTLLFIGQGIALYFIVWLMGGLTYIIYRINPNFNRLLLVRVSIFFVFVMTLMCIRVNLYPLLFNDFSMGLITALLLGTLPNNTKWNPSWIISLSKKLANISYSAYLVHLSFGTLVCSFFFAQRLSFSSFNLIKFNLVGAFILVYCVFFYYIFERNTPLIKRILERFLKIQQLKIK